MPSRRALAKESLLDCLDAEAEKFSRALEREYYLNSSGLKEDLSLAPIFEKHPDLFSLDTVAALTEGGHDDPRHAALRAFVVEGYLAEAAKTLSEELARRETNDKAVWQGREVPYRSLPVLIMNEPDSERRHQLDDLRVTLTAEQNVLREQRWDILQAKAREFGHPHYAALCSDIGSLDLERLADEMEGFLWSNEEKYRSQLQGYLTGSGVSPAVAERSDVSYLFRSPQFDGYFPGERLVPSLIGTLQDLGIDLDGQTNVHLDMEARPQKSPRAFCSPIGIPDEIMLVISPHGGQDDYSTLLHEAGHAQHFAHTDSRLAFAHRGLGDNAVTESYAFLLEHLTHNPAWLEHHLALKEPAEFLALARFHKLYMLRRYAAKLLYELELHSGDDPRGKAKRYCDLLTAFLGVRYSAGDYLFDVDDSFYCARYLRAWIFEAQLRQHLEREFGREWFLSLKAGQRLKELWSLGQRHPVEELARQIGYSSVDMAPLLSEVRT